MAEHIQSKSILRLLQLAIISVLVLRLLTGCSTVSIRSLIQQEVVTETTNPIPTKPAQTKSINITLSPTNDVTATPTSEWSLPLDGENKPTIAEILVKLENLPISEFFEAAYMQLLKRSPETITELGLSETFGMRDSQLDNLSDEYIRETQVLESGILNLLQTYDRESLTPQYQISYDVFNWYLDNQVRGHQFMYHNYPLHHFLGSWQFKLQSLFTEKHPLSTRQNAEDYISRLEQIDDQAVQLLEGLKIRASLGIIPPIHILELTKESLMVDLQIQTADPNAVKANNLAVYTHFQASLQSIEMLNETEKQTLDQAALYEIKNTLVPAYFSLIDYINQLMVLATEDAGAWKLPEGDTYYDYIFRSETGANLTPSEAHEIGLQEVSRIQAETTSIFSELGYPENEAFGTLMSQAVEAGGFYNASTVTGKQQVVEAYETILNTMESRLVETFEIMPEAKVIVKGAPFGGGGYYEPASLDGSRPGIFYAGTESSAVPKYNMPTIAYHEAIPGHHLQIALAQEANLPLFRNVLFFNGYSEGWAVYSERLAWEMGFYENDPYGNLGRLQLELLRAIRLVVDTGIHAQGWTREEAISYLNMNLGGSSGQWAGEVDRYIVRPGQASGYLVGLLEILRLRQLASNELGDQFDLRNFHTTILSNGGVPLEILNKIVVDDIQVKKSSLNP